MQTIPIDLREARVGSLPEQIRNKIEKLESTEELEALSLRILTAKSLEEMGL